MSRWASDTLLSAGVPIELSNTHSIRSASSSKSIQCRESLENVMACCAWKRESTFYAHYLRPVARGSHPTSEQAKEFFTQPKLVNDKTTAIPDSCICSAQ